MCLTTKSGFLSSFKRHAHSVSESGIGIAIGVDIETDCDCDSDTDPDNAVCAALSGSYNQAPSSSGGPMTQIFSKLQTPICFLHQNFDSIKENLRHSSINVTPNHQPELQTSNSKLQTLFMFFGRISAPFSMNSRLFSFIPSFIAFSPRVRPLPANSRTSRVIFMEQNCGPHILQK